MRTIFILVIFLLGCAKEKPMPREEPSNGCAGSPDNPQAKPFDYFYMKSTGRASKKAIRLKNQTLMEQSCIESTKYNRGDMILYLMKDSLNPPCEFLMCGSYYEWDSRIKVPNPQIVSCTGNGNDNVLPEIKALYTQLDNTLKIQFTNCKPTPSLDVKLTGDEWRECECTVYAHIPGGRKSIWEQCINLEKRFGIKN